MTTRFVALLRVRLSGANPLALLPLAVPASHVNERLAELDIDAQFDHRSFKAQGIDLAPQNKIGPAALRIAQEGLERERIADHAVIAHRNGERIIENPNVALDAITRQQAPSPSATWRCSCIDIRTAKASAIWQ